MNIYQLVQHMIMYKIFFASTILLTILFSYSREKRQLRKQVIVEPVKPLSVTAPFKVNVSLENSLSMVGYVNGSTDFKNATYSLLGKLSLSEYCRELNLYHVNSNVVPIKKNLHTSKLNFVNKLTPKTFLAKGADGMSSDLKDVLSAVLNRTD